MADNKTPMVTGGKKPLIQLPLFMLRWYKKAGVLLIVLLVIALAGAAFYMKENKKINEPAKPQERVATKEQIVAHCGAGLADYACAEKLTQDAQSSSNPGAKLMVQADQAAQDGDKEEAIRLYREAAEILIRQPGYEANAMYNLANKKIRDLGGTDRNGLR